MREQLKSLAQLLREHGDLTRTVLVENALCGTDEDVDAFLALNELWGGSGSIADSALGSERTDARRVLEHMLILLGNDQIRRSLVNPRTALWVEAFTKWESLNL
jgi:hypothetical protein